MPPSGQKLSFSTRPLDPLAQLSRVFSGLFNYIMSFGETLILGTCNWSIQDMDYFELKECKDQQT
jgi:hypothetical protein